MNSYNGSVWTNTQKLYPSPKKRTWTYFDFVLDQLSIHWNLICGISYLQCRKYVRWSPGGSYKQRHRLIGCSRQHYFHKDNASKVNSLLPYKIHWRSPVSFHLFVISNQVAIIQINWKYFAGSSFVSLRAAALFNEMGLFLTGVEWNRSVHCHVAYRGRFHPLSVTSNDADVFQVGQSIHHQTACNFSTATQKSLR